MIREGVWVTGIGAVSAAGGGAEGLGRMLLEARTGVRSIPELGGIFAAVAESPPKNHAARHLDRSARFFVHAAEEAWRDAGLEDWHPDYDRVAVLEGSSLGPMADLLAEHADQLKSTSHRASRPARLIRYMSGSGGAAFAQLRHIRGPVYHISAGSVSAAFAIGEAFEKIRSRQMDVVIAGGAECPLHPDVLGSFEAAGIMGSRDPADAPCRPFDRRRSGTVVGEGAGVLVLESPAHARLRGVLPWAVIRGFGMSCESHGMTSPDPTGAGVMAAARRAMGAIPPCEIGWIKTHGTGTRLNDAAECHGLAGVFGSRLADVPITSLKPSLGHCLGASAALEAVGVIHALHAGLVPPTLGTEELDQELPPHRVALDLCPARNDTVLLLAESFGGRCAGLVFTLL
jgi:3-oxoacyl-[acyl-carrier-protein] synthase II